MINKERGSPMVSVIVPTFRRPSLLAQAVASVLAQDFLDFELIVVDDDPAMSAKPIVDAFADGRMTYLISGRGGAAAARNDGIRAARGGWVAFLDDDDLMHRDFLSRMLQAASFLHERVAVLHCGIAYVNARGSVRYTHPRHRGDVHASMLRGDKSSGITGLIRRDALMACSGFDERLPSAQDWDLWIRISRAYYFDYIDDVLVTVRDHGVRISSDPMKAIRSREIILEKYADEFNEAPQARVIHVKRLGKLNAEVGQWRESWAWFSKAAAQDPLEWFKIVAWLLLARPGWEKWRGYFYGALTVLFSAVVAVYAQISAVRSMYMVNDDACQHIWWMRMWRTPGLFQDDLLAQYAHSLQNLGILAFYKAASFFVDPLTVARYLPFILFPLSSWALYRCVLAWTREPYAAFLTATAFMVTPIYMQHMAGGHAHVFGYPLLLLFLCAFTLEKYRSAAGVMILAALFFPVIFVLSGGYWLYSFCRRDKGGLVWQGPVLGERMLAAGFFIGAAILAVKFLGGAAPLIGAVLSSDAISRMPEVTSLGRWEVWPVMPVWQALVLFMEKGFFVFKAGYKTGLSPAWKVFLLQGHVLWAGLMVVMGMWWWRKRSAFSLRPMGILLAVSVLLYVLASTVLLKLYAPDRYVAYPVTLIGLMFIMIPVAVVIAAWPQAWVRRMMKVAAVGLMLAWAPLVKDAGLKDYSDNKKLYTFLETLPANALIAAYPDTADAIPLFSRRRVFINEELSVPLYDHYWETVRVRTFDFFAAYYAVDRKVLTSFVRRNNITHLVIERRRFRQDFLDGRVYFEPFGSWVRSYVKGRSVFYLQSMPVQDCLWADKDVCVVDATAFDRKGGV
ncbi:MAG: glycosyltransferase [Candidatus Omnitrophica bacterium]|nr:glycosyltransferase [Candidatus Omnitrophota bacterium]